MSDPDKCIKMDLRYSYDKVSRSNQDPIQSVYEKVKQDKVFTFPFPVRFLTKERKIKFNNSFSGQVFGKIKKDKVITFPFQVRFLAK